MNNKLLKAASLINNGHKSQAASLLAVLVTEEPNNIDAWYNLAFCLDDVDKKIYCLQRVVKLSPSYLDAQQKLDYLQFSQKIQNDQESDIISPAIDHAPQPVITHPPVSPELQPAINLAPSVEPPPPPQPKLKNAFWLALTFSAALEYCNLSYLTGRLGQIRPAVPTTSAIELLFNAIFNLSFYGFLFSLIIFFWRMVIKRIPGVKALSSQSGCVSMAIFGGFLIAFILLQFLLVLLPIFFASY